MNRSERYLLGEYIFAWVWVRHSPHLGHHYPVGLHVGFVGVALKKFAPVCYLS